MSLPSAMDRLALHHELLELRDRFDLEQVHHEFRSDASERIAEITRRLRDQASHVIDPDAGPKTIQWSLSIIDAAELTLRLLRQNRED